MAEKQNSVYDALRKPVLSKPSDSYDLVSQLTILEEELKRLKRIIDLGKKKYFRMQDSCKELARQLIEQDKKYYNEKLLSEQEITSFEVGIELLREERNEIKYAGNLLAVIHGDGGHYTDKHGWKKSTDDAKDKYYAMQKFINKTYDIIHKKEE
jgi:hypothetical protein